MKRWMAGGVTVAAVAAAAGGLAASGPARASSGAWYQAYQVNTYGSFSDIAAISKTNIWAVGDLYGKKGNTICQPFIRHYAGGGWKAVTIPGSPKFESDQVSAPAANDVWVFGLSPSSVADSVAYRYDGSRFRDPEADALPLRLLGRFHGPARPGRDVGGGDRRAQAHGGRRPLSSLQSLQCARRAVPAT